MLFMKTASHFAILALLLLGACTRSAVSYQLCMGDADTAFDDETDSCVDEGYENADTCPYWGPATLKQDVAYARCNR